MATLARRSALTIIAALTVAAALLPACDKKPKQAAQAAEAAAPAPENPNNAAPKYLALHDRLGKELLDSIASAPDSAGSVAALKAHKADIDEIIAATRLPDCDFGVKMVDFETPMPHLPSVRKLYKLLDADAKRSLAESNPVAAGARAAAMLRMARHLSLQKQMLMEVLIASSMADGALKLLGDRIDPGMVPDQVRAEIKDALAALDTPDFLNAKETALADLGLSVRAFRAGQFSQDGDGRTLSQADQDRAASEVETAIKKVPGAWDGPDPQSALGALASGTSSSAQFVLSTLPRTWKFVSEVKQRVGAARKKFGP